MTEKQIVIVGAGGHGRESAEIVQHAASLGKSFSLAGFVDEALVPGTHVDGVPVLGDLAWLLNHRSRYAAVIAIGTPRTCASLAHRLAGTDIEIASAISPLAHLSPLAKIGSGAIVFPKVVVNVGAVVGRHVTLNVGTTVSHDSQIGDFSNVNPGVHIAGGVTIETGCYIGMGSNIIQNIRIGEWTTVGAGAAVVSDLPSCVVAVGVPARLVKSRSESAT